MRRAIVLAAGLWAVCSGAYAQRAPNEAPFTLDARRSTLDPARSTLDPARSTLDAGRSTLDPIHPTRRPKVGLVLSGGGARGLAHIGVLKVLHELNVPVDVIAATSMGAMVGGSYAAGYTTDQLEYLARTTDWVEILSRRAPRAAVHFRRKEDDYRNLSDLEFGIKADGLTLPRGAVAAQNLGLFLRRLGGPVQDVNDLARLPIPFAAVATDLATGQPVVLQQGVSLAEAMRASTSLPGAFAPFEYRGRALVDGALVRNLPVDVARALGAQIVIVVNAGTPLAPREKLTDVLSVTEQVFNILTEQSVERTLADLGPHDILIRPDLGDYGVSDFPHAQKIMQAGEAAARAVVNRLRTLAVPSEQFAAFEAARTKPVREDRPRIIDQVRIEGLRIVNPAAVRSELNVPLGRPVTADDLSRAIQRIYGWGDFEAVSYSIVEDPAPPQPDDAEGRSTQSAPRTLVVTPFEKSWGYNTLRFGGNVQSNFRDDNTFNLLAAHTWSWLNRAGGELRNEVQIGELRRLGTEFYQPLAPGSRWFVLPRIWQQREKFDAFSGRQPVARFENVTRTAEVQVGYALDLLGSVRAGYGWSRTQTRVLIGPTVIEPTLRDAATASLELWLDTLDNISFPHRGYVLAARYRRYDSPVGSFDRSEAATFEAGMPLTFGRYTVLFNAHGASEVQEGAVKLGGLFNLSGTPYGAIAGSRGLVLRAQAYRNVSDAFGDIRVPLYAGFSFETGNAFATDEPVRWSKRRHAMAVYVGADTPVGPLYLAVGRTVGGASGFYLLWGRPQ